MGGRILQTHDDTLSCVARRNGADADLIAAETLKKRAVRESYVQALASGFPVQVIERGVTASTPKFCQSQNAMLPKGQQYTLRQLCVALGITPDQVYALQRAFWFPRPRGDHGRITGALFGTSEVNTWILSNRDRLSQLRQINRQIEDSFLNAEESAQHEGD